MGYLDNAGLAYFWGKVKAILPGGSSGGVPVGTIVIWSGTAEDIPEGWALCDGQDGRPDLRDKFVLGAGTAHAVGDTGGEETHTLTVSEMPEHSHAIKSTQNADNNVEGERAQVPVGKLNYIFKSEKAGGSLPHNNMPPYYALCYIIKTAEDSGGESAREVYSTEETRIGTWIDGKPLYQKVFQGIPIGTGWVSMGALAPEARAVMIAGWLTDIVGNVNPIPYQNLLGLIVNSGDSNIVSFNNFSQTEAFKNRPVTAIVKYTKTTD